MRKKRGVHYEWVHESGGTNWFTWLSLSLYKRKLLSTLTSEVYVKLTLHMSQLEAEIHDNSIIYDQILMNFLMNSLPLT